MPCFDKKIRRVGLEMHDQINQRTVQPLGQVN